MDIIQQNGILKKIILYSQILASSALMTILCVIVGLDPTISCNRFLCRSTGMTKESSKGMTLESHMAMAVVKKSR